MYAMFEFDSFFGLTQTDAIIEQDYWPNEKEKVLMKFDAVIIYHEKRIFISR
jgi:hypothetical protein